MPVLHRQRNGDGEVRTISLSVAIPVFAGMLSIITFLGGARWSEQRIASRLNVIEDDQARMHEALSQLTKSYRDHETWSATRSAKMAELEIEMRLLRQREEFYHGARR